MNKVTRIVLATVAFATVLPSVASAQGGFYRDLDTDLRAMRHRYDEITRHREMDIEIFTGGGDDERPVYEGNGPLPPPYIPTRRDDFGICYSCFY